MFWKGKLILLLSDDMIVYIKDPREPNKRLLDLMSKFSEFQNTRAIHLKTQLYFYTLGRNNWKQKFFEYIQFTCKIGMFKITSSTENT